MKLSKFNSLSPSGQAEELTKCCGSSAWVQQMIALFPFTNREELFEKSDVVWNELSKADWQEAFTHHPKIGDVESLKKKFVSKANFAAAEQASVQQAAQQTLEALAKGNAAYEEKFGYIFIVCASGKSADEMLSILQSRLPNSKEEEIKIAAAEQAKITKLRLEKLLS